MRRMMLLGVAAIAASAAAIAVASPARSGVAPPFVDDWFTASASVWSQTDNGTNFTYRQVVLKNTDATHQLTHMSTVQVYLLSATPGISMPPLFTTTVTLAAADNPRTPTVDETTWKYTYKSPTVKQPVGIKIVATHVMQSNDPLGGMQPTQVGVAWYPHAP